MHVKKLAGLAAAVVAALIGAVAAVHPEPSAAATLTLPFDKGRSFYVCQGYNMPSISHKGGDVFALDLTVNPPGSTACAASNASAGLSVRAPVGGTVSWWDSSLGMLCINVSHTLSIRLAHMNPTKAWAPGNSVSADQVVGTIAAAGTRRNNGVAHIHISVYSKSGCPSSAPIPFDSAHGTTLGGYNLPSNGSVNQYKGKLLVRPASPAPTPTAATGVRRVVVDDTSGGFIRYGPATTCSSAGSYATSWYWCWENIGYGGHMWYTWNSNSTTTDVNYGVWRPNLPVSGAWRVCAYIPPDHAYTTNAKYRISYSGGTRTVAVNQQRITGWVDLGTYTFAAGTAGFVRLGDATGEAFLSRQIGFDAVEWVQNGGC